MLSDQERELLCAYVDNEVGARQRKTVLRLLRRSAEARTLVRQMQEDSQRLRSLPRQPPAPQLWAQTLHAYAVRQTEPAPPRPRPPEPATLPAWLGLVAAAAVLVAVAVGSFLYFSDFAATRPAPSTTQQHPPGEGR